MIAIVNVGPHDDPDPGGWRDYEVRINYDVICRFRHQRSDGLEMCLLKAAEAVGEHRRGLLVQPAEETATLGL